MRAEFLRHEKITDELGNTIEIKAWKVQVSDDKPHGVKYSLVYIVNGESKGDHKHIRKMTKPYNFINFKKLSHDFYGDIEKFKKELK